MKGSISAVIIAKNEENMIADCIESVRFCEEIMVIDNESSDRTAEIAKHLGAKVISLKTNDFSILRNAGLRGTKGKWILYVDADERVSDELKNEIVHLITNSDRVNKLNAYMMKRKNFYFGSSKKNEWPYVENILRLFRKDRLKKWVGQLHESPIVDGETGELSGFLFHYTHRDLSSMVQKTLSWSKIEAELRFKSAHPKMAWWRFPRVMMTAFYNSYIGQRGYKVGVIGLIESLYQAYSIFLTYARLWELQEESKVKNEK